MNKAATGKGLSRNLYRLNVGRWGECCTIFMAAMMALALLCAGLTYLGLRPPGTKPASFDFMIWSATFLLVSVFAAVMVKRFKTAEEETLKESWRKLYSGTVWTTLAGERVEIVETTPEASNMQVRFADGATQWMPFSYLTPANKEGPEADFSGLRADRRIDWSSEEERFSFGVFCHFLLCWGILAVSLACAFRYGLPSWGILPALVGAFTAATLPIASVPSTWEDDRPPNKDFLEMVSMTQWKAMDGRIGTVRGAQRRYHGEGRYGEKITLAFPEGDTKTYNREDLKPLVFEC
jgi:hypothetical protein